MVVILLKTGELHLFPTHRPATNTAGNDARDSRIGLFFLARSLFLFMLLTVPLRLLFFVRGLSMFDPRLVLHGGPPNVPPPPLSLFFSGIFFSLAVPNVAVPRRSRPTGLDFRCHFGGCSFRPVFLYPVGFVLFFALYFLS